MSCGDGTTQVRGGTGLFTGKPPFVWISNQIGNTGVLYGFLSSGASTAFPFNPNPDKYKPAATGRPASSYELDVTDPSFRFPQTWRTNIGADRRLPWGLIGTGRLHLQQRPQRPRVHQREPAAGRVRVHGRR